MNHETLPTTTPPTIAGLAITNPAIASPAAATAARLQRRSEWGQATAEYALVMLAAAAFAGLLLAWALGTDGVSRLLDAVMDKLIGQIG